MSKFKIYKANTIAIDDNIRAIASSLEYSGTWMGDCSLSVTVKSPVNIEFSSGDYVFYRGEEFYLDLDPTVKRQARKNYYGEAFLYEGLAFYSAAKELKACDFLDFVISKGDDPDTDSNVIHFSASSNVVFFASTVRDLAARMQANLFRLYPDLTSEGKTKWDEITGWPVSKWKVVVDESINTSYDEDNSNNAGDGYSDNTFDAAGNLIIRDVTVSIQNMKVWDSLELISSKFKTTYTIKGRTITIGSASKVWGQNDAFAYYDETTKKRKGLVSLERAVNSQYDIVTRLRAYGSSRNLPTRFYTNSEVQVFLPSVDGRVGFVSDSLDSSDAGYTGYVDLYSKVSTSGHCPIDITAHQASTATGLSYTLDRAACFIKTGLKMAFGTYVKTYTIGSKQYVGYDGKWSGYGALAFPDKTITVDLTIYNKDTGAVVVDSDMLKNVKARAGWYRIGSKDSTTGLAGMYASNEFFLGIYFLNPQNSQAYDSRFFGSIRSILSGYTSGRYNCEIGIQVKSGYEPDYLPEDAKLISDIGLKTINIANLMLPGFPRKSLQEFVYGEKGSKELQSWIGECYEGRGGESALDGRLSTDAHFPYIDSPTADDYGIRESSVYFDGSNDDFDEIYPTLENMEWNGVVVDVVSSVDTTTFDDDGVYYDTTVNPVKITIPYGGFDLKKAFMNGENAALSFKNGMCAGREFSISRVISVGEDYSTVYLERSYDDSVKRYFPYKDYPIKTGDKFVITNIPLPEAYIEAASIKAFKQAVLYLSQHDKPLYTYSPLLSKEYIRRELDSVGLNESIYYNIKEGDSLSFEDKDLGISEILHLKTLTIREGEEYLPTFEITIQEKEPKTKLSSLEKQVNNLSSGSASTVGQSVNQTVTSRKLSAKLDYAWLSKLFVAYDSNDREIEPNSDDEVAYVKLADGVVIKDKDGKIISGS